MPVLVDTWNVLHQTGVLPAEVAGPGLPELIELIRASRYRHLQVTLVCDGTPPTPGAPRRHGGVTIRYSGTERSADDVIMQVIERSSAPRNLMIVSSDRAIQRAARKRRCEIVASPAFLERLAADHAARNAAPAPPPATKPAGSPRRRGTPPLLPPDVLDAARALEAEAAAERAAEAEARAAAAEAAEHADRSAAPPPSPEPPPEEASSSSKRDLPTIFGGDILAEAAALAAEHERDRAHEIDAAAARREAARTAETDAAARRRDAERQREREDSTSGLPDALVRAAMELEAAARNATGTGPSWDEGSGSGASADQDSETKSGTQSESESGVELRAGADFVFGRSVLREATSLGAEEPDDDRWIDDLLRRADDAGRAESAEASRDRDGDAPTSFDAPPRVGGGVPTRPVDPAPDAASEQPPDESTTRKRE